MDITITTRLAVSDFVCYVCSRIKVCIIKSASFCLLSGNIYTQLSASGINEDAIRT